MAWKHRASTLLWLGDVMFTRVFVVEMGWGQKSSSLIAMEKRELLRPRAGRLRLETDFGARECWVGQDGERGEAGWRGCWRRMGANG